MAFLPAAQLDPESRKKRRAGAPIATGEIDPAQVSQQAASIRERQAQIQPSDTFLDEPAGAPVELGAPEEFVAGTTIREGQTPEGFTRRVEDPRGGFGEITTAQPKTTDTPEQVQEALAGVEARSDVRVQNILRQQEQAAQAQAPTTASQIQELEAQLATPGRGLRQSFGELLTETQGRRTARERLDKLYAQQKTETTQAGQTLRAGVTAARTQQNADRSYDLAVRRLKQSERKEDRSSQRKAFEDMREITTGYAEQAYPDDPAKQQGYIAKQLETATPGFLFNTPEGRNYTRVIKEELVDAVQSERGLYDALFGDTPPDQADVESLSFKGWKIGDAGPWFGSETVAKKGKSGNYAYLDNLSDEQVWIMEQLIRRDNPEDYPNQKQESLRTGQ